MDGSQQEREARGIGALGGWAGDPLLSPSTPRVLDTMPQTPLLELRTPGTLLSDALCCQPPKGASPADEKPCGPATSHS